MYIVHLTTEFAPLAKVGGLGDVVSSLSKALIAAKQTVEVILPFYSHIDRGLLDELTVEDEGEVTVWSALFEGIPLRLIDPQGARGHFFRRGKIYGEEDDLIRFTSFAEMAFNYLLKHGKSPDVLNIHDWLTAFAAPLYHETYRDKGLQIGKRILTIHNMKYQGVCSPDKLPSLGDTKKNMIDPEKKDKLNLLKGGIFYSDKIAVVSPTYAEEIQGEEGFGLGPLLIQRKKDLCGILNGIDTTYWNPQTDPFLEQNYPAGKVHLEEVIKGKQKNWQALQKKFQMGEPSAPLFTAISRLVDQKGPELIQFGIEYILSKGGQFILLGSAPDPKWKKSFLALAKKYSDNPNVYFHFLFDEPLAHLTFAAADAILVPSLFEPCGLTQMIALRYGTLPIVHSVGGLRDTVFDSDDETFPIEHRNGYTFTHASKEALQETIDRAFNDYRHAREKWEHMMANGLQTDWSWNLSAQKYLSLYA